MKIVYLLLEARKADCERERERDRGRCQGKPTKPVTGLALGDGFEEKLRRCMLQISVDAACSAHFTLQVKLQCLS